ncbi:MAG: Imm57 family immunity protein [Methylophilus sp.]
MRLTLLITLLCYAILSNAVSNIESREIRELNLAENAIFTSLIVDSNPSSQSLCTQNAYACLGPDSSELGLALIAAKNSPQALTSLGNIMRYRLDGALSEDYSCYVLEKGKKLQRILKKIKPETLESNCKNEIIDFEKKHKNLFEEGSLVGVCSDKNAIKERLKNLLISIGNAKKCNPEDF